ISIGPRGTSLTKSAPYKVSGENRTRQSGTCEATATAGSDPKRASTPFGDEPNLMLTAPERTLVPHRTWRAGAATIHSHIGAIFEEVHEACAHPYAAPHSNPLV